MCIVKSDMLNQIMFGLKYLLQGSFGSLGQGHWGVIVTSISVTSVKFTSVHGSNRSMMPQVTWVLVTGVNVTDGLWGLHLYDHWGH